MKRPRTLPAAAATAALMLALTSCSAADTSEPDAATPPAAPAAPEVEERTTLETVWERINCQENDPMVSRGQIQQGTGDVSRTGACYPLGGDSMVFFYELDDTAAAHAWVDSGELEVGPSDTVLHDGGVVILTTDDDMVTKLGTFFDPLT